MKKRTRGSSAPDITPLIDVVFLLLIFFMVSTVFKRDELALLLNLPKSEFGDSAEASEFDLVTLELSVEDVAFNGQKVTLDELDTRLQQISKKETPIDIRIDKAVQYDRIVLLFDKLKKSKLSNISLVTESL